MKKVMTVLWLFLLAATVAPATDEARVTRVLYLQDIEVPDVMRLLRSRAAIASIAVLDRLDAVVVSDVAEQVDLCEELLVERGALARTAEPHAPVLPGSIDESDVETRVFSITGGELADFATLLRSTYAIKQLAFLEDENALSVTTAVERLDQIEAMLNELGAFD